MAQFGAPKLDGWTQTKPPSIPRLSKAVKIMVKFDPSLVLRHFEPSKVTNCNWAKLGKYSVLAQTHQNMWLQGLPLKHLTYDDMKKDPVDCEVVWKCLTPWPAIAIDVPKLVLLPAISPKHRDASGMEFVHHKPWIIPTGKASRIDPHGTSPALRCFSVRWNDMDHILYLQPFSTFRINLQIRIFRSPGISSTRILRINANNCQSVHWCGAQSSNT